MSISTESLAAAAETLLASCLANPKSPDGEALETLLVAIASRDGEVATAAARLFIGRVVEGLSDRFEPALVDCYVDLFSQAVARCHPLWSSDYLTQRYQQLSQGHSPASALPVDEVFVLSRITLGADIAITSVFLDAVSKRYPQARVWLVGSAKNHELFSGRVRHWPFDYPRGGTLRERIQCVDELVGLGEEPGAVLIDPDSRISQLGLLPLLPSDRTLFFESRAADPDSPRSLSDIASSFCFLRLAVPDARPFLALPESLREEARHDREALTAAPVTISLGVGGNPAKRLDTAFEASLLRTIAETGRPLWIDAGAGGAEAEWVRAAIDQAGLAQGQVQVLDGSFAKFCAYIAESAFYVGYDSAGQHAAAALGIPGFTFFRGFVNERMMQRWTPRGPQQSVFPLSSETSPQDALHALASALQRLANPHNA